ncbi:CLUMA_CG003830, isoform A [Clunio marinus]|uniref:CLUMA_CG003830, isoform A n=1 Tax=Clunio marinus TaxID=568069 RepID=A0A1J1HPX7_9DIPT|nr:CLUMA_CG003830, isoform A [Clunio marinus]
MKIQILVTLFIISINYVCAENQSRYSILAEALEEYLSSRASTRTASLTLERDGDNFQATYEVKDFLDEFLKKKFTIPKIGIRIETFAVPTEHKRVFQTFIVSSYEGLSRILNERSLKDILLNGHFLIILPKCENHDFEKVRELNSEDLPEFLKEIRTNPNFKAAYADALLQRYLNFKNSDESQHICKEAFATNLPVVIYSLTDFYLLNALNEKILEMIKAGLIDQWKRESFRQNVRHVQESIEPKVLTVDDLEGSFLILMFGCLLGFIAFLCEKFLL